MRCTRPRIASRRVVPIVEGLEGRLALSGGTAVTNFQTAFQVTNDWGSGFTGQIAITNFQSKPVASWMLGFDFGSSITQIWNASIVSHVGTHYVVANAGYDASIASGSSVTFGFNGTPGHPTSPTNYTLTDGASSSSSVTSASATFQVTNDWGTGFGAQITIANNQTTPITNWSLAFDFAPSIDSIWNAQIASHTGIHYVIANAGFNATIPVGGTVSFGFNGSPGSLTVVPTGYILNGVALGQQTQTPSISVADTTVQVTGGGQSMIGFLHTQGNQILDADNQPVKLAGVNWFGMETTTFAPDGLWARNYKDMMDQMKQLGFNVIRLPFSDQLFDSGSVPNGINYNLNPDLQGLNGLGIMDKVVAYAGQIGLRIFLDHHRSEAGASAEASGLWYTSAYPVSRWISDWTMLAKRYAGNPTVIGADLANEPHGPATWGSGDPATDWRLAAEQAGNAILAVNPNWLIIVEGIQTTSAGSDWWGGNLSNAGQYPVVLSQPGHVVYSPHDYPASVYPQTWFSDPSYPKNLPAVWNKFWGYIYQDATAPILLGEFGSKLQTASDQQWASTMVNFLQTAAGPGQLGMSWTWWSWNPNSGDTGGILNDDWTTVNTAKVNLLKPIEAPLTAGPPVAAFTVTLSTASQTAVTVHYATANGTAHAGTDYTAESGTLTFAPGVTTMTVFVPILGGPANVSDQTFLLDLLSPTGGTIGRGQATATIKRHS
jgi:aryl-phospho-beta-D-glucosidase BglC (GH1 family)